MNNIIPIYMCIYSMNNIIPIYCAYTGLQIPGGMGGHTFPPIFDLHSPNTLGSANRC